MKTTKFDIHQFVDPNEWMMNSFLMAVLAEYNVNTLKYFYLNCQTHGRFVLRFVETDVTLLTENNKTELPTSIKQIMQRDLSIEKNGPLADSIYEVMKKLWKSPIWLVDIIIPGIKQKNNKLLPRDDQHRAITIEFTDLATITSHAYFRGEGGDISIDRFSPAFNDFIGKEIREIEEERLSKMFAIMVNGDVSNMPMTLLPEIFMEQVAKYKKKFRRNYFRDIAKSKDANH